MSLFKHALIAADISLGVIHDRANRPTLARQSEVVNNSETDISCDNTQ
jgi:hypothetical protein